jgi:hypothetical protein
MRILNLFKRALKPEIEPIAHQEFFDQYEPRVPSDQNAIDALPGWSSAFPLEKNLTAGDHHLHGDPRIHWAISQFGSLDQRRVLEVGPLEGMHTYLLNQQGPALLDSVEANRLCFLRCLVTKEILGIDRARFHLGDIQQWLEEQHHYDLAIASGVLYHMPDPGDFLRKLASRSGAVYIWTHYFDDAAMPEGDIRRSPFSGKMEVREIAGCQVRYYERHYWSADQNKSFCGGMKDKHFWMHRDDIITLLRALGFNEIVVDHDQPDHSGGPCYSIFCRKT